MVRTLNNTREQLQKLGHEVEFITPLQFKTWPCPTYPDIRLAWRPYQRMRELIERYDPNCLHIATEGPLGWAARRVALETQRPFTTAYHTRFPEYVRARFGIPLAWTYAVLRRFHAPSRAVMAATPSVISDLKRYGFDRVVTWGRGVDLSRFELEHKSDGSTPVEAASGLTQPAERPVFLFAGRVAVEKNIEAFLHLDLPGTQWVAGDGPMMPKLRSKYPHVKWLGMLGQDELARVYQQADVFVFPSKTDTFGLVMLEAMACGLPVAAYPVTGPMDVVGQSRGAALHEDLKEACLRALTIPREVARQHAERFSWAHATAQFVGNLYDIKRQQPVAASFQGNVLIHAASPARYTGDSC